MKKIILSIYMVIICLGVSAQSTNTKVKANEKEVKEVKKVEITKPNVSFNEGVDLVSIVFRLAGAKEYNLCSIKDYAAKTDDYFNQFKNHPVVKLAAKYQKTNVGYDAVASYGLHLLMPETPDQDITFNPKFAPDGDDSFDRWTDKQKAAFLVQLNDFYQASNFFEWYQGTEDIRQTAIKAFDGINTCIHYEWFSKFFSQEENSTFDIYLSILVGPHNYGCSAKMLDNSYQISPVIGCCSIDENGDFYYEPEIVVPIVIHEFCHHYCNPLNGQYWNKLEPAAEKIFKLKKEELSRQAYSNAQTMMNETFVRASVIRYMANYYEGKSVSDFVLEEEDNHFVLTNDYVKILTEYEENRGNYTSVNDIMPNLIDVVYNFDIKGYEQRQADYQKNCATYTCNIENKSKNIPAGYFKATITFSKPMVNSIAIGYFNKPAEFIPFVKESPTFEWNDDSTVLTLYLKLEAGHHYGFSILGDYYKTLDGYKGVGTQYIEFWTK